MSTVAKTGKGLTVSSVIWVRRHDDGERFGVEERGIEHALLMFRYVTDCHGLDAMARKS